MLPAQEWETLQHGCPSGKGVGLKIRWRKPHGFESHSMHSEDGRVVKAEVLRTSVEIRVGSIPTPRKPVPLAQWITRLPSKEKIVGSIPTRDFFWLPV